jgi:D-glycero-alpha-D-manno-heptose-7-phosphate kinase
MLIVRSPLRISLAGGGTDLPAYYREYGGLVINAAIDRYFYVFLRTENSNGLDIASSDFSTFFSHHGDYPLSWDGDLYLPRAILHHFGISKGIRLFIASEIPPGTGLGSSSSVSVGLIKALSTACSLSWTSKEIAELAVYIEINKLGSPIGKQDQYAAAFGGLNLIEFKANETTVTRLHIMPKCYQSVVKSLMLFYTRQSRSANEILLKQREATEKKSGAALEALHQVKAMVPLMQKCLETGDIKELGSLLHKNWMEKRKFARGVSNSHIDACYETARASGAYGGKITGAGGGGFFLICCEESEQERVTAALEEKGLVRIGFNFDNLGARVIMNSGLLLTSHSNWERPQDLLSGVI